MKEGRASRTAEQNALFRALESLRSKEQRLFDDPLARHFLNPPLSLVGHLGTISGLRDLLIWYIDRRWPGVRSSVVARTRLIDDMIKASVAGAPISQMVILGAGFDSRAYRLAELSKISIFEVDHPSTQAAKRSVLERVLGRLPEHVKFAPCDFTRDDLGSIIAAAGFDQSAPTFILWEGVTNYLTHEAVDATLRWCAAAAPGSVVLFTYVHRDVLTRPETFVGTDQLFASLAKADEKLSWGIEPEKLPTFLADRGLQLESDIGAAQYRERYYGAAAQAMRGHEFYRIALARICGAEPRSNAPDGVRSRRA